MAIKESLALNRCGSLHAGRDQATIARSELYAGKSFINLQWPWFFGLRVDMTPIVEPECDIAVLLNFKDDNILTQTVNRPTGDEYGISRIRGNADEVVRYGSVKKRTPQTVSSRTRLQACVDPASFLSLNYNPCFGLCRIPAGISSGCASLGCT
jgi:hypothetical protein